MVAIIVEGFENAPNLTNGMLTMTLGASANAYPGRTPGGQTVIGNNENWYITCPFTSGSDTIYWHEAFYIWSAGIYGAISPQCNFFIIRADSGAVDHLTANLDATGHITLRRGGSSGTIIATSTQTFVGMTLTAWRSMQVKATIHDTTGECVIKVDGEVWINYTGDTRNGGTSTRPDVIVLPIANGVYAMVDDFFLCDTTGSVNNSWTGDVVILPLRPVGNGANSGLLGSDGNSTNNFDLVDEVPASMTDYNGSPTANAMDTYDVTPIGRTGSVLAMKTSVLAQASDAGAKSFKHVLRSATPTTVKSSAVALSSTAVLYTDAIRETDADGNPLTVARVDAAEFGFEVQ